MFVFALMSLTQILGSWMCSDSRAIGSGRVVIAFKSNHIETLNWTQPKIYGRPSSFYFTFNGYTLDEKTRTHDAYSDSVTLSGGTLRITRISMWTSLGGLAVMPHLETFTCRRDTALELKPSDPPESQSMGTNKRIFLF
jgi:hypothetical protein